ncbi:alpha/beta hydrolase fold domain-containing protein [Dactylosporangium sp. NPDC000244]|uniref:alpha/beta hydrolase fold domain-containing protein n=1 Tax=Dactylosporangium sp. NPDC000244 TaxID=3154365 RepID=UPI0033247EA7
MSDVVLEPAAREFAEAASAPPFVYQLTPEAARKALDDVQAGPVAAPPVDEQWVTVSAAVGDVRVRVVRPQGVTGVLPVVLYVHGGGWVLGNAGTHDRLVREIAVGAGVAVVFVAYTPSPEAHYPVAIEQIYAAARWIVADGASYGLDVSRLAIAGDSVGGNMTAAVTLLAKQRGDVRFVHQSMYYPVTDAGQDTASYAEFADGPHLTAKAMAWFWDCYAPDHSVRSEITASPLRATPEELAGLPPAFLLVDEADVLRDEGEAFAAKLRAAGVPITTVRYDGTCHDFMMLNPLKDTNAAKAATAQAIAVLRQALHTRTAKKIVVIGGSGLIGSKVVNKLREHGHDVVAASPASGVNTLTGEGLAAALTGAQVVVDVTNSPSFEETAVMEFFTTSTRNLLAAEAAAGVTHHVALSIVGIERPPGNAYFRAKVAQERLIGESTIPYSIVRVTQFFEFVDRIAAEATEDDKIRLSPALIQPMAAEDVAGAVCEVAVAAPVNGIAEFAGPERFPLDELVRIALRARNDPRTVISDPHAPYFGQELEERSLVPDDGSARLAGTRFDEWLGRTFTR